MPLLCRLRGLAAGSPLAWQVLGLSLLGLSPNTTLNFTAVPSANTFAMAANHFLKQRKRTHFLPSQPHQWPGPSLVSQAHSQLTGRCWGPPRDEETPGACKRGGESLVPTVHPRPTGARLPGAQYLLRYSGDRWQTHSTLKTVLWGLGTRCQGSQEGPDGPGPRADPGGRGALVRGTVIRAHLVPGLPGA